MARTGAACLAVSIGNVHGIYRDPPRLDWERLEAIRSAVAAPLSLHGASGIADADVRRAIAAGVAKINVNTELREAYLAATAATIGSVLEGQSPERAARRPDRRGRPRRRREARRARRPARAVRLPSPRREANGPRARSGQWPFSHAAKTATPLPVRRVVTAVR